MRFRQLRFNAACLARRLRGIRTVVFECQQPRDWDFLSSVFDALSRRAGVRCLVLVNDRTKFEGGVNLPAARLKASLAAQGVPARRIASNIGRSVWFADFYCAATVWENRLPVRRRVVRAAAPHGLVNKVDQYGEQMREFDVLFSTGPLCTENARKALRRAAVDYRIWEVGYPKLDRLLAAPRRSPAPAGQPASRSEVRVLFAPTWGRYALLDRYGLAPVDVLAAAGFRVIVKLHPMTLSDPSNVTATGGADWRAKLRAYAGSDRVIVGGDENASQWMETADVMVSDASGAAFEFLLLDKPVIFMDCPEYFGDASRAGDGGRVEDLSYWGRKSGAIVSDPLVLPQVVDDVLAQTETWRLRRRGLAERLLYNPGVAGEAAAKLICRHLAANAEPTALAGGAAGPQARAQGNRDAESA